MARDDEREYRKTPIDAITDRHMARTLSNLEEAGCPVVFVKEVRNNLRWLRQDLNDLWTVRNE